MFTTGSKLLFGSAFVAAVAAVVYGLTQEGALGTIGLASAALALAFLGGVELYVRDATVPADDAAAVASAPATARVPSASVWPLLGALGVVAVGVGLVTHQPITVVGIVLVIAAIAEWMLHAWSERASADDAYNDDVRERVASPLELPVLAAIGAGGLIYLFSRVMLNLEKAGTVFAFAMVATLLLIVAGLLATRRGVRNGVVFGMCALIAVALLAGGAVAALVGEREMHEHPTTGDLGDRGECGEEETEADEDASQSVSAKANVTAEVTLEDDGTLSFEQPGFNSPELPLTIARATPSNIIFRNDSAEERRLVMADIPAGDGEVTTVCTALTDPGGSQFLTLRIDRSSSYLESGAYQFTVPGVETATLPVVVP